MGIFERLIGDIEVADVVAGAVNCVRWENPMVWLCLPFWLPLVIVLETVALIVLWTAHDKSRGPRDVIAEEVHGEEEDEDEEEVLKNLVDIDAVKSLFMMAFMLPLMIPAAMVHVLVEKFRHSKFGLTPDDARNQSYKNWRYQRRMKRRLTFGRRE